MKFYKVINNEFQGFYDLNIHKNTLFDNKELKKEYRKLPDKKWQELLDEQSHGKEIRILNNGELGAYKIPVLDVMMVNPMFNYKLEKWEETASKEEQLQFFEQELILIQQQIKEREEVGFAPTKQQLDKKNYLIEKHKEISLEIALKLNNQGGIL